ncbi:TolB family protein [Chloroflexota bacterium]
MNLNSFSNELVRNLVWLAILFFVAGCSVLPGTLEVSMLSPQEVLSTTLDIEELTPVLKAIAYGTVNDRKELVSFSTTTCTSADGLGGPPKCEPNEEEGTLVEVLPVSSGEGSFSRPDTIDGALDFVVMGLFSIYRVPDDAHETDYSPAGEYGLIFAREMNAVPFPVTVFVENGRIVRIQHHVATDPQEIINQLPAESIVMTPKVAQDWMDANEPEAPDRPEYEFGSITGSLCFPGEQIPEMIIYFQEINRGDLIYQSLPQNQSIYSSDGITPGSYIAFAYPVDTQGSGGIYSQAVNCGLSAECTDHSLLVFEVKSGQETGGVDICDWDSPADVPDNPRAESVLAQGETQGHVNGEICYPSESIPAMTAFFKESSSGQVTELPISENQASYNVELNPGRYVAFAYLNSGASFGGSYSNIVLCGLTEDCSDHSLVEFEVISWEILNSIDICDWYSPDTMPPDPRAAMEPLANLVYLTGEGDYYRVEPNGNSELIFSGERLAIPYSGSFGVYAANNDLQAVDLFTGEGYQLTITPDLLETSYHFEVGVPEALLFTALPVGEEIGPGYTGGLYIINMDGTNQRTLDDEHNAGNFSASPDGQKIAYGAGETAFLYDWETGIEVFDPRDYGFDSPKGQAITSPSWSPAGDQLAWYVYGFFNAGETQGIGIFDMFNKTFQLIHPYQALGTDITPPPVKWSPDEEWLVFTAYDQDPSRSGVWLVNLLNPQQEFFMGTASSNPVFGPWREGSKILTYSKHDLESGESQTWTFDLVTGEHKITPLPTNAQIVTWW